MCVPAGPPSHWSAVFYGEPGLWCNLQFSDCPPPGILNAGHDLALSSIADWLAGVQHLTKLSASVVTAAAVCGGRFQYWPGFWQQFTTSASGEATVDILQLLQPSMLMELAITWRSLQWPEAVLQAAARFTGLTKLQLGGQQVPQAAAITAAYTEA